MFNNISPDETLPLFGEDGDIKGEMDYTDLTQVSRLDCPITLDSKTATFSDIAIHILLRQRIGESTIKRYMIYLRMMETHTVPVNLRTPDYEEFIRHMDYREQIERATPASLEQEWQAMKHVLTAYGIPSGNGTQWNYRPPSKPPSKKRWIPLPSTVHEMIHHRYCKDDYKNALIQYTFMHGFMIGWRNPSEMCMMKLEDVDLENRILTITEKKKHNKQRIIVPEKSIMTGATRKSFKNWIDKWRPKVANQKSGNALYLRKNGRPITEKQYRSLIYWWVLPTYPKFQLYASRHWCAIASLIKEKLETNHWNEFTVRNLLGHDRVQTTMTYIRDAEQYMQLAPYDWFKCVLKYHKKAVEENTLKTEITPKDLCFDWKLSESDISSGLHIYVPYGGFPPEIIQNEGYFDFQPFTLSLFFNNIYERSQLKNLGQNKNELLIFPSFLFYDSPTPHNSSEISQPSLIQTCPVQGVGFGGHNSDAFLLQSLQSNSTSLTKINLITEENGIFSSFFPPTKLLSHSLHNIFNDYYLFKIAVTDRLTGNQKKECMPGNHFFNFNHYHCKVTYLT